RRISHPPSVTACIAPAEILRARPRMTTYPAKLTLTTRTPRSAETPAFRPLTRYPMTNARTASTPPGSSARTAIWRPGCSFVSLIRLLVRSRVPDDHQPRPADRSEDQPDGQEQRTEAEQPVEQVPDASPDQQSAEQDSDDGPGVWARLPPATLRIP